MVEANAATPIRWRPEAGKYLVGGAQHKPSRVQWKLVTGAQWMLGAAYVGGCRRSNPDPVEAGSGKVLGWWKPTQAFSWQWKLITGAQWMLGAAYVGGCRRSNPDPVEAGSGKALGWRMPTQAFS